jgi:cation-transporting ATPase 13A3/4/5
VISTKDLAFGDRIYLKENETVPCDVVVVKGSAIVNESMLTGESIPIVKTAVSLTSE